MRNERHAQSEVWDLVDYSARLNLDYSLGRSGTVYLTGEYRRGDTVSDGHATLVNVSLAKVFVLDDAFPDKQLFAYRSDARTWLSTVGYNLPLGQRTSIDISASRSNPPPCASRSATTTFAVGCTRCTTRTCCITTRIMRQRACA